MKDYEGVAVDDLDVKDYLVTENLAVEDYQGVVD
jgi:hypothetical protein